MTTVTPRFYHLWRPSQLTLTAWDGWKCCLGLTCFKTRTTVKGFSIWSWRLHTWYHAERLKLKLFCVVMVAKLLFCSHYLREGLTKWSIGCLQSHGADDGLNSDGGQGVKQDGEVIAVHCNCLAGSFVKLLTPMIQQVVKTMAITWLPTTDEGSQAIFTSIFRSISCFFQPTEQQLLVLGKSSSWFLGLNNLRNGKRRKT